MMSILNNIDILNHVSTYQNLKEGRGERVYLENYKVLWKYTKVDYLLTKIAKN